MSGLVDFSRKLSFLITLLQWKSLLKSSPFVSLCSMTVDHVGVSFVFVLAWKFRSLIIDSISFGYVSSMDPSLCLMTCIPKKSFMSPKSSTLNFNDEFLISFTTFPNSFSVGLNMMQSSMYTNSVTFSL